MPNVTIIPATINPHTHLPTATEKKRRVAGYARVSTDMDEQFASYEAQIEYYTRFIQTHEDWEFVEVYTDEGISATSTKKRDGFNRMIDDALSGLIDLIVTKSVSRFARNTVDSLTKIRLLKEKGVEVYFEKENIWTFDGKGELLLTIMSSLAQEESRSISENVSLGKRWSAQEGRVSVPYSSFLGYDKGENKCELVVNPEQAEIVKRIYRDYMAGKTPYTIAKELTEDEIPTPGGKTIWTHSSVLSILKNEKYKGCAILQKTYVADFLTKKIKKNNGELPQYCVTDSHEAIIPPDEWAMVQEEIDRRKNLGRRYSGGVFASKIVCGVCGGFYGKKVWQSNTKYRKTVWQCNNKYDTGKKKCRTPAVSEEKIKNAFLIVFNRLYRIKDEMIANCEMVRQKLTDTSRIDSKLEEVKVEAEVVDELVRKHIKQNANHAQDQEEYQKKYDSFIRRYDALSKKKKELTERKKEILARADSLQRFAEELRTRDSAITEFDARLWRVVVKQVVVERNGALRFELNNGTAITV